MLRCTAVASVICSLAFSATSDSGVAALAAPGDCAQPGSALGTATGTVDALTNTATRTTTGILGGLE